ncbi:protein neprosin-like [Vicia villosa]|uniref:protein neprosin-like n=1 Tax=Vicia villosa TaxID=3911 RepID=UPI00273A7AEB|nr:protein neprosin-like [Vicia villosa]
MRLFVALVLSFFVAFDNVDAKTKTLTNETHYFVTSDNMMRHVDFDFDCIDIYKQPSLKHRLLKNHKIQLYPTFTRSKKSSYVGNIIEECSIGKVPFYKKTKRHRNEGFRSNSLDYHSVTLDTTEAMTFHGAHALMGIYDLQLKGKQYSLSGIWIESGPPSNLNSIFFGTGVMPYLYGDSQVHLTARWTAGGSECYNSHCPGFVQVHSSLYLGMVLSPVDIIGKFEKEVLVMTIKQDKSTGHWWLCLHYQQECFGYWPKEFFPHLSSGASVIKYGGETYTPPGMVSPPMGSGRLPQEKFKNSSFMKNIEIINLEYNEIDIQPKNMKVNKGGNLNCYDLIYLGDQGAFVHQALLFGGPGGKSC